MPLHTLLLDTIVSPIEQSGNYFILDTEKLVSNPFTELTDETVATAAAASNGVDVTRKATMTEKLTNIKNNICDTKLNMEENQISKEQTLRAKSLQETSNKLRYEIKLWDIDKRTYEMDIRKRVEPNRDYRYDEQQIQNSRDRIGSLATSYYLDKRTMYPMRHQGLHKIVTPTLAMARKKFHDKEIQKQLDEEAEIRRAETEDRQAAILQSVVSRFKNVVLNNNNRQQNGNLPRRAATSYNESRFSNRDTNIKPLTSSDCQHSTKSQTGNRNQLRNESPSKLPNIAPSKSALSRHRTSENQRSPHGLRVKFSLTNPEIKTENKYAKIDKYILDRAKTFHSGMSELDTISGDDTWPRKINLRALLFNDNTGGGSSKSSRGSIVSNSTGRKRSMMGTPHLTQDMIEKQSHKIQNRVNKFLGNVTLALEKHDDDSDSDSDDASVDNEAPIRLTDYGATKKNFAMQTSFTRRPINKIIERLHEVFNVDLGDEDDDDSDFWNKRTWKHDVTKGEDISDDDEGDRDKDKAPESISDQRKASDISSIDTIKRYLTKWQSIVWKASKFDTRSRQISADDLLLERILGIQLQDSPQNVTHIPKNTAGRALRHTATFKMRKVVETLMLNRTKYVQHEVDEIKKKIETDTDTDTENATVLGSTSFQSY